MGPPTTEVQTKEESSKTGEKAQAAIQAALPASSQTNAQEAAAKVNFANSADLLRTELDSLVHLIIPKPDTSDVKSRKAENLRLHGLVRTKTDELEISRAKVKSGDKKELDKIEKKIKQILKEVKSIVHDTTELKDDQPRDSEYKRKLRVFRIKSRGVGRELEVFIEILTRAVCDDRSCVVDTA